MKKFIKIFAVYLITYFASSAIIFAVENQDMFCKINKKYSDLGKKTNKSLKLQLYKRKRKNDLSKLNYDFEKWTGKIEAIDSVGDDSAYVSVSVCKNVTIKTWNNSFSDLMNKTLINIDSELYEKLLDLEEGDKVIISGRFTKSQTDFFQESSMTDSGSLSEPEFIVNFEDIIKIN